MRNTLSTCFSFGVALLGSIYIALALPPVFADDAVPSFVRVPVFFVTDRNLAPSKTGDVDFGPQRKYVGDCKHDPFMGSAYSVMENIDKKPLTDHLKELGWSSAESTEKERVFKATPITGDDFEKIQKVFYGKVHDQALLTPDKNLFLFAHGYKNTFGSGLHTAARLAYSAERPVILYSWPSASKLRGYNTDENNIEWSQEHFNDVVRHIEQLCTDDPSIKVRMMAHSMGTRLLIRATPFLAQKKYLVEAALICPDIDDGLVKHYARRYLSVNGTAQIRLYMSRRDKALAISQIIHGGYTRLGEQADALGDMVGKALSGQNAKADTEAAKASDAEFADRLNKTKKRMQTIDFTNIDIGMLGHNVPAKMICSMSFTGTPGPGLELVDEESGQRSKLSNYFTKLTKLNHDDGPQVTGTVLKIVKDDPRKKPNTSVPSQPSVSNASEQPPLVKAAAQPAAP